MSGRKTSFWLTTSFSVVCSLSILSTAKAEYHYYHPQTDGISYQTASYQPQHNWQNSVSMPPVVLPYVPFDNEQVLPWQPTQQLQTLQLQTLQPASRPAIRTIPTPQHAYQLPAERRKILDIAHRQMGIRYRWGGNTPREGFDCSGFTKYAHKFLNVSIPRTAAEQSRASRTISRGDLQPGDMIFFKTKGRRVNHVGIYIGNGRFIHAASGGGKIMTDDLRKSYWQRRLVKYGTFLS